jgi:hypothetical protein
MILVIAGSCRKAEVAADAGTPAFSLDGIRSTLSGLAMDNDFYAAYDALVANATGDSAASAELARTGLDALAVALVSRSDAMDRVIRGDSRIPGAIGQHLRRMADAADKGGVAGGDGLRSLAASVGGLVGGDLGPAIALADGDGPFSRGMRLILGRQILEGLRRASDSPEFDRGRVLVESVRGLPVSPSRDPAETAVPATLGLLARLLHSEAGDEPAALASARSSLATAANEAFGNRIFAIPVTLDPNPRGTPVQPVLRGGYQPLVTLTVSEDGLHLGARPAFAWEESQVKYPTRDAGHPGALVIGVEDLAKPSPGAIEGVREAVARVRGTTDLLEKQAFGDRLGGGVVSGERADGRFSALVLANLNLPAQVLEQALLAVSAAAPVDIRLVPPGPVGHVLPAFVREPPDLPDAPFPKGPRILVVVGNSGCDLYPASAGLPMGEWPEGISAVPDARKRLFKLAIPWSRETGYSGMLAAGISALRERSPSSPLVDMVVADRTIPVENLMDAVIETVASPGETPAGLASWFPGLTCPAEGRCVSSVPVLAPRVRIPRQPSRPVTVQETRPAGFCEAGAVKRIVLGRSGAYRACYEVELRRRPELEGRVEVRFTIEPDGTVSALTLTKNELNDNVARCILQQMSGLRFPKPDGGVCVIRWPFRFQPGG